MYIVDIPIVQYLGVPAMPVFTIPERLYLNVWVNVSSMVNSLHIIRNG